MKSISEALLSSGVPLDKIKTENFGPSSLVSAPPSATPPGPPETEELTVTFTRSGKKVIWAKATRSLLQLAERNGVEIS